jgi:predicted Rossmann fold flavoprotein
LEERGVNLKIEEDGRVFPVSDNSQTIIDLFLGLCKKYKIQIKTNQRVERLESARSIWSVNTKADHYSARQVMWATGSSPSAWKILGNMGHRIVPPVPSLFTFNIADKRLHQLAGISVPNASILIDEMRMEESGPLLITHWGMSGPAVLKLSSRGARLLHTIQYRFEVLVNWSALSDKDAEGWINENRRSEGSKLVVNTLPDELPKRLWIFLTKRAGVNEKRWADLKKQQIECLIKELTESRFTVNGKSTFKEEFVTAGGVDTIEVNFTTMESRKFNGLYLAGEVINIDALTGGFNFQAAWTEAYIAARSMT